MLRPYFGVHKDGELITSVPLRKRVETGIAYEDYRMALGFIPEYEEREAAIVAGYTWRDWEGIDTTDRAMFVAHNRLKSLIEAHIQESVERDAKRRQKSK